jgi:hypothetical protein
MTDTPVESLVRDSGAPLAAVELPSGRFLAVNPPLAKVLGSTVDALTGSSSLDQLSPAERHSAELGFGALADGHLTGYQAIRTRESPGSPGSPGQAFSVWVNAVEVGGTRVGLISVTQAAGCDGGFRALPTPAVRSTAPGGSIASAPTSRRSWGSRPSNASASRFWGRSTPRTRPAFSRRWNTPAGASDRSRLLSA